MWVPNRHERIKGVIFDLDGTLISSSLNFSAIREHIGCPATSDILEYVAQIPCSATKQKASDAIKAFEIEDAISSQWIEGAELFLQQLAKLEYPMAIVTRNCREATKMKCITHNIPIQYRVTREDAPAKPDPTALLMIAKEWQLEPSNIAYVGDYLYDVQAANNAGMMSLLYSPNEHPTYASQATYTFSCFKQLLATCF